MTSSKYHDWLTLHSFSIFNVRARTNGMIISNHNQQSTQGEVTLTFLLLEETILLEVDRN